MQTFQQKYRREPSWCLIYCSNIWTVKRGFNKNIEEHSRCQDSASENILMLTISGFMGGPMSTKILKSFQGASLFNKDIEEPSWCLKILIYCSNLVNIIKTFQYWTLLNKKNKGTLSWVDHRLCLHPRVVKCISLWLENKFLFCFLTYSSNIFNLNFHQKY